MDVRGEAVAILEQAKGGLAWIGQERGARRLQPILDHVAQALPALGQTGEACEQEPLVEQVGRQVLNHLAQVAAGSQPFVDEDAVDLLERVDQDVQCPGELERIGREPRIELEAPGVRQTAELSSRIARPPELRRRSASAYAAPPPSAELPDRANHRSDGWY